MNPIHLNKDDFRILISLINKYGINNVHREVDNVHKSMYQKVYKQQYPVLVKFVNRFGPYANREIQGIYNKYLVYRGGAYHIEQPQINNQYQINKSVSPVIALLQTNQLNKHFRRTGILEKENGCVKIPANQLAQYVQNVANRQNIQSGGNYSDNEIGSDGDYLLEFANEKQFNTIMFNMCGGKFKFPKGFGKFAKKSVTDIGKGFGEGTGLYKQKEGAKKSTVQTISKGLTQFGKKTGSKLVQQLEIMIEDYDKKKKEANEAKIKLQEQEQKTDNVEKTCGKELEGQVAKYKFLLKLSEQKQKEASEARRKLEEVKREVN